jgi:hypothetical protein
MININFKEFLTRLNWKSQHFVPKQEVTTQNNKTNLLLIQLAIKCHAI